MGASGGVGSLRETASCSFFFPRGCASSWTERLLRESLDLHPDATPTSAPSRLPPVAALLLPLLSPVGFGTETNRKRITRALWVWARELAVTRAGSARTSGAWSGDSWARARSSSRGVRRGGECQHLGEERGAHLAARLSAGLVYAFWIERSVVSFPCAR